MDLSPTPEQELLVDTASDFVARTVDAQAVRVLEAGEPGYDRAQWATMADLGWTDLEPLELALVADRLGRGPLPSPLVVTGALRAALPDLAAELAPDAVLTLAVLAPGAPHEWADPAAAGGDMLTGTFVLVPYAASAGVVVVATTSGLVAIDPAGPGVTLTRHDAIGGDPVYRLECTAVASRPVAGSVPVALDHLAVASLAYTVGVAERALALTVQHAKDRHQFGRPIGAFQAVAHRCADMRAEVDACRVLACRAAWALDRRDDREFAVASALAYANDALRRVAMHAHQVHGAIGFSTEHDLHLFTRRIKAYELTYGSTAWHQDRLATAIGLV
ncbi:MAG: acyl-CoA dehydrogenase [Acidimicrobiia bacterium]|jgi:alkylation response protein AidB-like acyl-CoA dehydrogenase